MNDYQKNAVTTIVTTGDAFKDLMAYVLGLGGESGEVLEKVKKIVRDKQGVLSAEDKEDIIKELGDVLWYIAVIADELNYDLQEVADINVKKLQKRKRENKLKGSGDNR